MSEDAISVSDWIKGIGFSILASVIGASSKLAIRKSWLIQQAVEAEEQESALQLPAYAEDSSSADNHSSSDFLLMQQPREPPILQHQTTQSSSNLRIRRNRSHDGSLEDQNEMNRSVEDEISGVDDSSSEAPDDASCDSDRRGLVESSSPRRQNMVFLQVHETGYREKRLWKAHCLRFSGFLGMTIFNPAASVIAMNYASPSILAPFAGLTLVWVILFSQPVVGEAPTTRQVIACSFILVGEVVVAVFGDHTNDEGVTIEDVKLSYQQVPFQMYFVGLSIWMLLLARWMSMPTSRVSATLQRFSWGVSGGSITGLQNFLKDALTVLKASESRFPPSLFFVFFVSAALSAFIGLLFLTLTMKRYDTTYSAAMFVGSFVVSASIMSAIHYQTFQHLAAVEFVCYPGGLVLLMIGVFLLATHDADDATSQSTLSSLDQLPQTPPASTISHESPSREPLQEQIALDEPTNDRVQQEQTLC